MGGRWAIVYHAQGTPDYLSTIYIKQVSLAYSSFSLAQCSPRKSEHVSKFMLPSPSTTYIFHISSLTANLDFPKCPSNKDTFPHRHTQAPFPLNLYNSTTRVPSFASLTPCPCILSSRCPLFTPSLQPHPTPPQKRTYISPPSLASLLLPDSRTIRALPLTW